MAAKKSEMSELHEKLAQVLKEEIGVVEPSPAMLNVARQFLRDSGIEVDPDNKPVGVEALEKSFDEHFVEGIPSFEN